MRKSIKFKKEKEKFEANLLTIRRMISLYSEKTVVTALLFKLKEIKHLIKDVEELNHISELIINDLKNQKKIFEELTSVFSIDNKAMEKFSQYIIELITPEYISKLLLQYDKKEFKVNSYLVGQETIANNISDEDYSLFLEN